MLLLLLLIQCKISLYLGPVRPVRCFVTPVMSFICYRNAGNIRLPGTDHISHFHFVVLPPFPPNWGSQPPVKTCIVNCGQTVPDATVACIHSLWEVHGRIRPPRGASSPKMGQQNMPNMGCVVGFLYTVLTFIK